MMYEIAAPIQVSLFESEPDTAMRYMEDLKKTGVSRVFLCLSHPDAYDDAFAKKHIAARKILRENGFKIGAWVSCIYHNQYSQPFTRMVDIDGKENPLQTCPTDPDFLSYYADFVRRILQTGEDLLMIDDDFRMNFNLSKTQCFCENHMKLYRQNLGRDITRGEMKEKLFHGSANAVREAWLTGCRRALLDFAVYIRKAADEINSAATLAICSAPALWGVDGGMSENGTIAIEITKILAGSNPPYLRICGGPMYMSKYFQDIFPVRFANIVDFSRREAFACHQAGIPAAGENDSYPRPRTNTPAVYLEIFDMITRADGHYGGELKYMFDYVAHPSYETGYVDEAIANRDLYRKIDEAFSGKQAVGIRLFAPFDNLRYRTFETDRADMDPEVEVVQVPGIRFLNDNSLPVVFEGDGPVLVCGEDARQLPDSLLANGVILDITAAKILTERGVDVGLACCGGPVAGEASVLGANAYEVFDSYGWKVTLRDMALEQVTAKETALCLSRFVSGGRDVSCVYRYENAAGQRFLVYPFDMYQNRAADGMLRSYGRQRQLVETAEYLAGRPLDAVCLKHPDLYMMVKKNDHELAVGLWNIHPDRILKPAITLGDTYASIEVLNGEGSLSGNTVTLEPLGAYDFNAFVVKR